ncbi:MAG: hypothetical protein IJE78_04850 [Bacteroidaceae bacterium]|nr:hypothetical protein [Bacteroidaceae bacterium]
MGKDLETVKTSVMPSDPLIAKQREDVAKMRASLLCCTDDPFTARQAMQNITVLRVYHQVSRIIRYLDVMDRLEEKLYAAIDAQIDKADPDSPMTWMSLLKIQEQLMDNMIKSHKLLEPYLNIQEFVIDTTATVQEAPDGSSILTKESRDKLRTSAQQVLAILGPIEEPAEEAND